MLVYNLHITMKT